MSKGTIDSILENESVEKFELSEFELQVFFYLGNWYCCCNRAFPSVLTGLLYVGFDWILTSGPFETCIINFTFDVW